MAEKVVETKTCTHCGVSFTITDKDIEFYDKMSPIFNEKKYQILTPTFCPDCRQQRRLTRRNERKLYKRNCDASGKQIISNYSEDKPYKIYDQKIWRSDKWDPMEYSQQYDFSKKFFQQFDELMKNVPQCSLTNFNNDNSDYANYMNDSKNCYLDFGSGYLQDCCYCNWVYHGANLLDCGYCFEGENSYMCIKCEKFYHCMYCQESKNITDCYHCFDCENCTFCLGCIGLRSAQYCILNKQYTKEEYEKVTQEMSIANKDMFTEKLQELKKAHAHNAMNITSSEHCIGNDIKNSKNAIDCYEANMLHDCKYCVEVMEQTNLMDVNNNGYSQWEYEIMGFGYNNQVAFALYSAECTNVFYSAYCQYSKYLFACVGLQHKEYCIFNKQYTKEEYEELVPKIINHMQTTGERGEFFPIAISPFTYNETVAHEYYPLHKEQALREGYLWTDKEFAINIPLGIEMVQATELPAIKDTTDDILNKAIICEITGRPFRIVKMELDFYRRHNLPLPHRHPDQRHLERMQLKNPRKLRDRQCGKCGIDITTTYAPERTEMVYCETCYNKEIYG